MNYMKYLRVIVTKEREFETVPCRFERDHARAGGAIDAAYSLAFDAHEINRGVESVYDAMISVCICQLVYITMVNQNKTS